MGSKRLDYTMLEAVAHRFRALSEINRLQIVQLLQIRERSVGEIVSDTGLSQPNVSRHLKILADARLISKRRAGTTIIYSIADRSLSTLCTIVCESVKKQKG